MLFLVSSMRENVWNKDRSSQFQILYHPSLIVVYLVFSADQNGQFNNNYCNNLAKERVANLVLGVVVKFM